MLASSVSQLTVAVVSPAVTCTLDIAGATVSTAKLAVTSVGPTIVSVSGLTVPLRAPLQPTNAAPPVGCAVKVTDSPQP